MNGSQDMVGVDVDLAGAVRLVGLSTGCQACGIHTICRVNWPHGFKFYRRGGREASADGSIVITTGRRLGCDFLLQNTRSHPSCVPRCVSRQRRRAFSSAISTVAPSPLSTPARRQWLLWSTLPVLPWNRARAAPTHRHSPPGSTPGCRQIVCVCRPCHRWAGALRRRTGDPGGAGAGHDQSNEPRFRRPARSSVLSLVHAHDHGAQQR